MKNYSGRTTGVKAGDSDWCKNKYLRRAVNDYQAFRYQVRLF